MNFYYPLLIASLFSIYLQGQKISLNNVNIVDVESGKILENHFVLIEDDRILEISQNSFPETDKQIIAKGKYMIPGLWDMHVHLSMLGEESIPLFVLNGVTGVRDMGGDWAELKKWRVKSRQDDQSTYPYINTAGPILESKQFFGLITKLLGADYTRDRIAVDSEKAAVAVVDSLVELGVDLVKIRTAASQTVFNELAKECREHRIPFTGHIDQTLNIQEAVEQGINTIEHDLFLQVLSMDEDQMSKILKAISKHRPGFTPTTLATYNTRLRSRESLIELMSDTVGLMQSPMRFVSPRLEENWRIQLQLQAFESPVNWDSLVPITTDFARKISNSSLLLAGTDVGVTGIIPGSGLHEEMNMMVEKFEKSNLDVLRSGTCNAAKNLQMEKDYGSVTAGKKADLVLLNNNPLEDINHIKEIFMVVKNGEILSHTDIETGLEKTARQLLLLKAGYEPLHLNHLQNVLEQMKAAQQQKQ